MNMILAVAAGGALGALARYGLGHMSLRLWGPEFPYGTLIANILGGFLMGVFVEVLALKLGEAHILRGFVAVGLLGGFTTFSSYSLEVVLMIERGQYLLAGLYAGGSALLAITALFCGLFIMRWGLT